MTSGIGGRKSICVILDRRKQNRLQITLPIIEVNDIVIHHIDKLPRSQWKLGLVT